MSKKKTTADQAATGAATQAATQDTNASQAAIQKAAADAGKSAATKYIIRESLKNRFGDDGLEFIAAWSASGLDGGHIAALDETPKAYQSTAAILANASLTAEQKIAAILAKSKKA